MSDYLTTRELAELLRIKERKVYELAAAGEVPCSRATGKLLFPRDRVNAWLAQRSSGPQAAMRAERPTLFLGSHDPLLEWALRESRCGIATLFDGSVDGLQRFANAEGIATGLHLHDPTSGDWNTAAVTQRCAGAPAVLVQWASRQRGLIVRESIANNVGKLSDLRGRCVAPRQAEAGAQTLLLQLMAEQGLDADTLTFTAPVRTEADAALAVLEEKADAAFGLATLAHQYRLPFVPIIEECFDLLVDRRAWFEPPMQQFLSFCRSSEFKARAQELSGYNIDHFGRVRFNSP